MTETIIIDPKDFIMGSYLPCPKCNAADSFGVLMVCQHHYVRRCKKCRFSKSTPLPNIRKTIIYLDQFVISSMMKSLNPETTETPKNDLDKFWSELFNLLDRLCKLQLIVCPYSMIHLDESWLSPFPRNFREMYRHLSGGLSFHDPHSVQRFQICEQFLRWLNGNESDRWDFDVKKVLNEDPNTWMERLSVFSNWEYQPDWIDGLRKQRDQVHNAMVNVFQVWQKENHAFEYWFKKEAMAYGQSVLQQYENVFQRNLMATFDPSKLDVNDFLPTTVEITMTNIFRVLRDAGVEEKDFWPKINSYFSSDALEHLPFNRISAMLYAAMASKANSGKKKPPTLGTINDVEMISTYLPYCDVMFIDREFHGYLVEKPLCDDINYGCRIFSVRNKDEFFTYLKNIEGNSSPEHLSFVREVYGNLP